MHHGIMTNAYIIKNQRGLFLSKDGLWLDKLDKKHLYRTVHHDEALNTLLEANTKDVELRLDIHQIELDAKGHPSL